LLRRFGIRQKAAIEYQKASKIEEAAFGRENPCLAYLWRKIACLAAIVSNSMDGIIIEEMDRMDGTWLQDHSMPSNKQNPRQSKNNLHESRYSATLHPRITETILKGDSYYKSFSYSTAVEEYRRAATTDVRRKSRRRSRSSSDERKRRSRSSRSRSKNSDRQQSTSNCYRSHSKSAGPSSRRGRKLHPNKDGEENDRSTRTSYSDQLDGLAMNELDFLIQTVEAASEASTKLEITDEHPSSSNTCSAGDVQQPSKTILLNSEGDKQKESGLSLGHQTIVSKSRKKKTK
jgi:hypothetical protein